MSTQGLSELVDELVDRFQHLGMATIKDAIDDAIQDLSGSVHDDSLAEMATRLAMFRLGCLAQEAS